MGTLFSLQFWAYVGVIAGIYGILSYSLQLQYGFCGLLNFGQVAFMAISGYAVAILVVKSGLNLWLSCVIAIALSAIFGVLMGIPTLRLRADYFAIVTIAVGEIVEYLITNLTSLTGGAAGSTNLLGPSSATTYNDGWLSLNAKLQRQLAHVLGTHRATSTVATMIVVWVLLVIVALFVRYLSRSPWGRVLKSIRDEEDAAAAIGKNVFRFKLQVLAVGGALGGLAGVLYAFQASTITPTDFDPLITFYAWTILILGGPSRVRAVPLGAALFSIMFAGVLFFGFPPFSWLGSDQRSYLQLMIIGAVLIVLIRLRPQGLLGHREEMLLE